MPTEVSRNTVSGAALAPPETPERSAWWGRLVARLPFRFLYGLASVLGWMTVHWYPYREHVVRENLKKAFPQFDEPQLRDVVRRYYLGFAQMLMEIVKSVSMPAEEIRERVRI